MIYPPSDILISRDLGGAMILLCAASLAAVTIFIFIEFLKMLRGE